MADTSPDTDDIARLRDFLESRGITQRTLAITLQVDKASVWRWVNRRHPPSQRHAALLASVLADSDRGGLVRPEPSRRRPA
jgi:transcriptional regulator with XRE-family HTH domain